MSIPRMYALSTSSNDLEKHQQHRLIFQHLSPSTLSTLQPGTTSGTLSASIPTPTTAITAPMFPALPFMAFPTASTPTSMNNSANSVFPPPQTANIAAVAAAAAASQLSLFNPHIQQYYANFLHHQQQQMMQNFHSSSSTSSSPQHHHQHPQQSRFDLSPSVSDGRTSSHIESPVRKLQTDDDGNPICVICGEKLKNEREWYEHVEMERINLIKTIAKFKEQKIVSDCLNTGITNCDLSTIKSSSDRAENNRRKREYELMRIRSNQQKRNQKKNQFNTNNETKMPIQFNGTNICSSSSSSRYTAADTCNQSPTVISNSTEELMNFQNYCISCKKCHEYLIISANLDEPRCYECYMKFRSQTSILPTTITMNSPRNDVKLSSNSYEDEPANNTCNDGTEHKFMGTDNDNIGVKDAKDIYEADNDEKSLSPPLTTALSLVVDNNKRRRFN